MNERRSHNDADALEQFFKNQLEDATMEPSLKSWDKIEKVLQEDERRKRRGIIWISLSGLLLILGISVGTYFIWFNNSGKDQFVANNSSKNKSTKKENNEDKTINNSSNTGVVSSSTGVSDETVGVKEIASTNNTNSYKIQIGAFKKKTNNSRFKNLTKEVMFSQGNDGITRYYIESVDTLSDLTEVKKRGYVDAFVNYDINATSQLAASSIKTVSANDGSDQNQPANASNIKVNTSVPKTTLIANNEVAGYKRNDKNSVKIDHQVKKDPSLDVINKSALNFSTPKNFGQDPDQTKNNIPQIQSNINSAIGTVEMESSTTKNFEKDSVIKDVGDTLLAQAVLKDTANKKKEPDPLVKNEQKKKDDSDTTKDLPFYRWAIGVYGGPSYMMTDNSNLYAPDAEKGKTLTYTGHLDLGYKLNRNFEIGGGFSYQQDQLTRDSTHFRFSKYITGDYAVKTSYGDMNINKDILLQGFYMAAPIDTFWAAYSFKVDIKAIQVPVHAKWYFINGKYIQLAATLGAIPTYTYLRKGELTLIKEHTRDVITYNDMKVRRFNMLLLMGLNCDVRLSKRFSFTMAPGYKYGLTNTSSENGVKYKPSYFSGMAGLKFRF